MPLIVWVIGGVLLGAMLESGFFGAVVGGLIAWLFHRSQTQQRLIQQLQERLKALRAVQPEAVPTSAAEGEATPRTQAAPSLTPIVASAAVSAEASAAPTIDGTGLSETAPTLAQSADLAAHVASLQEPATVIAPPTRVAPGSAAHPVASAAQARSPNLFDRARAWLMGGNTIAKAGIGILFIGLAFLAKYASDQALLPVEFRLAGIGAVALALLTLGWRQRLARPAFGQALQGGAVAVLYLTLFASFRFYGVLAAGPVFALMVVVAALAAALAVRQEARSLAVIGALGGFATPLLVSSGGGAIAGLFAYYLVLDLGIAAVAWFRNWRLLNAIGALFTFSVASAWGMWKYDPSQYAMAQGFLIAYFLLFTAVLLMPARGLTGPGAPTAPRTDSWINGGLLFGVPTVSFVLQHGLVRDLPFGTALSALALAAFYVGLGWRLRRHPALSTLFEAMLAIATVFISLVIPFALDANHTGGAWALEGAGLLWLGWRQQRRIPRLFGYLLMLLAGATLLVARDVNLPPGNVFNAWAFNALLLALGAMAGAYFVHRGVSAAPELQQEASAEAVLMAWGLLWALGAAGAQISLFVTRDQSITAWLAALSVIGGGLLVGSLRLRWRNLALPLIGLAPALLWLSLCALVLTGHPAEQGGWWAWPLALTLQWQVLRRVAGDWPRGARHAVHAIGPCVLAILGANGGASLTGHWGDSHTAWPWLGALAVPALLLLALPHARVTQRWPVRAEPQAYLFSAGSVLAVSLLLWTLLANQFSTGDARPLPHLPLLNPLDLGVAAALLAVWRWRAHPVIVQRLTRLGHGPTALQAAIGFVWINAMLLRGFHHWAKVPYRWEAWADSLAVQTGVTLLWSVTALALMWASARRLQRTPWMVGAALLAAVVAKLLLVDLSGSGTVTRIVSFIGVGLLMLVIAYVAPLPANATSTSNANSNEPDREAT